MVELAVPWVIDATDNGPRRGVDEDPVNGSTACAATAVGEHLNVPLG
jgi:hypothetical protein